jgi:ribosomal protein S15P/S13E
VRKLEQFLIGIMLSITQKTNMCYASNRDRVPNLDFSESSIEVADEEASQIVALCVDLNINEPEQIRELINVIDDINHHHNNNIRDLMNRNRELSQCLSSIREQIRRYRGDHSEIIMQLQEKIDNLLLLQAETSNFNLYVAIGVTSIAILAGGFLV